MDKTLPKLPQPPPPQRGAAKPPRPVGRPHGWRKPLDADLAAAVQKIKTVMEQRRRALPGWTLSQEEVDWAADCLAPLERPRVRRLWQALGGSTGTVADMLDVWWHKLIRERRRPAGHPLLDEPTEAALKLRERLSQAAAVTTAGLPSEINVRELLFSTEQLKQYQLLQSQLEALRQNEQRRQVDSLELKREFVAGIGTVLRALRERPAPHKPPRATRRRRKAPRPPERRRPKPRAAARKTPPRTAKRSPQRPRRRR
jgi:hypothetical protein